MCVDSVCDVKGKCADNFIKIKFAELIWVSVDVKLKNRYFYEFMKLNLKKFIKSEKNNHKKYFFLKKI